MATTEYLPDGSCIVTFAPGELPEPAPYDPNSPTIRDVATTLAGNCPPAWLVDGLALTAPVIVHYASMDASLPPPKELQRRLDAVERASALLLREMGQDSPVLSYMTRHRRLQSELDQSFACALDVLAEIEASARQSARHVKPGAGRKIGAQRRGGLGYLTARGYCALCVIEAWTVLHGKPPGSQNEKAQEAADCLWTACFGPALARDPSGGSLSGWRASFDDARQSHNAANGTQGGLAEALAHGPRILRWAFKVQGSPHPPDFTSG